MSVHLFLFSRHFNNNKGAFIDEQKELSLPQPRGPFRVHKDLSAKIIVFKLVPGFDDDSVMTIVTHATSLKAIVFEMYGTGNGPPRAVLLSAISLAKQKGEPKKKIMQLHSFVLHPANDIIDEMLSWPTSQFCLANITILLSTY